MSESAEIPTLKTIVICVALATLCYAQVPQLPVGPGRFHLLNTFHQLRHAAGKFQELNAGNGCPNAMAAIRGRGDSLWITSTSGLYVLPLHTKMEFWSARDGLKGTVWTAVRTGTSVFATADAFNEILDPDRSHWRVLPIPGGRVFPGPGNTTMAASNDVVVQVSSAGQILRRSPKLTVWLMARAPDGSEWAGGTGVYRLSPSGSSLRSEPKAPDQRYIQGIHFDRQGDLWTCSAIGLTHLRQWKWTTISTQDGLLQNACATMTEDRNGDIWYAYDMIPVFAHIQNPRSDHPVVQQFQNEGAKTRTYFLPATSATGCGGERRMDSMLPIYRKRSKEPGFTWTVRMGSPRSTPIRIRSTKIRTDRSGLELKIRSFTYSRQRIWYVRTIRPRSLSRRFL